MNHKAQELSMNVIIIAAIALLVLVIISVLVLKNQDCWEYHEMVCTKNGIVCLQPIGDVISPPQCYFEHACVNTTTTVCDDWRVWELDEGEKR